MGGNKGKMTDKQFWMRADQIAESKSNAEEKTRQMTLLLKSAYVENIKLVIANQGDHQVYFNLDDEHPDTIGNRCMLCYTSKRKAVADPHVVSREMEWGYAFAQDVLNNFFNKVVAGYLVFNCYNEEWTVVIPKDILIQYIPGPHPVPDNFVDVHASGYPILR